MITECIRWYYWAYVITECIRCDTECITWLLRVYCDYWIHKMWFLNTSDVISDRIRCYCWMHVITEYTWYWMHKMWLLSVQYVITEHTRCDCWIHQMWLVSVYDVISGCIRCDYWAYKIWLHLTDTRTYKHMIWKCVWRHFGHTNAHLKHCFPLIVFNCFSDTNICEQQGEAAGTDHIHYF